MEEAQSIYLKAQLQSHPLPCKNINTKHGIISGSGCHASSHPTKPTAITGAVK